MEKQKLTVFLSHSHKDEEKIKKIRNILEMLDCEPLIFFFKCLDDDNTHLEDFIKREIEARNIFLYCKSGNSEKSAWVQKELEYIRSFDKNRLYTVDIDNDYCNGMIKILNNIVKMIQVNSVFICNSERDSKTADLLAEYFYCMGMKVTEMSVLRRSVLEVPSQDYFRIINEEIKDAAEEGVILMLTSENYKSSWYDYTVAKAVSYGARIIEIEINEAFESGKKTDFDIKRKNSGIVETAVVDKVPSIMQLDHIYNKLIKL